VVAEATALPVQLWLPQRLAAPLPRLVPLRTRPSVSISLGFGKVLDSGCYRIKLGSAGLMGS
jgi:hypothetical protein